MSQKRQPGCHALPDREVPGANMGPTWDLSAPDGPHVGPINLAIRAIHLATTWASKCGNRRVVKPRRFDQTWVLLLHCVFAE